MRSLPLLHPDLPDIRPMVPKVSGIIFDSAPYVLALDHITLPDDFKAQLAGDTSNVALRAPRATPAESKLLDLEPEATDLEGIAALVKHSFGFSLAVVPLIIKMNKYIHWFWTPATFTVIFLEYVVLSLKRKINRFKGVQFMTTRYPEKMGKDYLNPGGLTNFSMEAYIDGTFPSIPFPSTESAIVYHKKKDSSSSSSPSSTAQYPNLYCIQGLFDMLYATVRYPVDIPELFLYSDKDLIIKSREVEKLMYIHVKRGSTVFAKNFKKSIHVGYVNLLFIYLSIFISFFQFS